MRRRGPLLVPLLPLLLLFPGAASCGGSGPELIDLAPAGDLAMAPPPDLAAPLPDLALHDLVWRALPVATSDGLRAVVGVRGALYAVGGGMVGGLIFRSDNGGPVAQLASGTGEPLFDIAPASDDILFTVGGNGTILISMNGTSWLKLKSTTTARLTGVFGTVNGTVWAVGDGGAIQRSVDFGQSWQSEPSETKRALARVWGSGGDDVYAVGEQGTILHSKGGAAGWMAQASDTSADLAAVWGSGRDEVWTGGVNVLLRTSDGGASWKEVAGPWGGGTIRGIWASAPDDLYVACDPLGLLRSRDRGKSWTVVHKVNGLAALWGRNRVEVWAAGPKGLLLRGS